MTDAGIGGPHLSNACGWAHRRVSHAAAAIDVPRRLGRRQGAGGDIRDDRVVDHQLNRDQRGDPLRITSHKRDDRVADRDKGQPRHSGEVL